MEIAVGFINESHSGVSVDMERAAIEARARDLKIELAETLVVPRTSYMPMLTLYQTIAARKAAVVIVPTSEHVWSGRRGLTEQVRVEIVSPPASWAQGTRWPRLVSPR